MTDNIKRATRAIGAQLLDGRWPRGGLRYPFNVARMLGTAAEQVVPAFETIAKLGLAERADGAYRALGPVALPGRDDDWDEVAQRAEQLIDANVLPPGHILGATSLGRVIAAPAPALRGGIGQLVGKDLLRWTRVGPVIGGGRARDEELERVRRLVAGKPQGYRLYGRNGAAELDIGSDTFRADLAHLWAENLVHPVDHTYVAGPSPDDDPGATSRHGDALRVATALWQRGLTPALPPPLRPPHEWAQRALDDPDPLPPGAPILVSVLASELKLPRQRVTEQLSFQTGSQILQYNGRGPLVPIPEGEPAWRHEVPKAAALAERIGELARDTALSPYALERELGCSHSVLLLALAAARGAGLLRRERARRDTHVFIVA